MDEPVAEKPEENKPTADALLTEMKGNGINGAVLRTDGLLVSSTISLSESGANTFASLSNVCDALLKSIKDVPREIEISTGSLLLVLLPVGNYVMCGVLNNRDQKKQLREYADKLKQIV